MVPPRRHTQWPEVHSVEAELNRAHHQDLDHELGVEPPSAQGEMIEPSGTTQSSLKGEKRNDQWGITWRIPILVVSSFLASILTALGHHLFYLGLENTQVGTADQQTWSIRIGTGLAFLNKTFLVAIMGMVGTQIIWVTLRQKFMTLRGIDSMFQIMYDPTAIFDSQLWTRAKTLLLLAVMSWFIPLVAVVTPATLSIKSSIHYDVVSTDVSTVNFANATSSDWATLEGAGRISSVSFQVSRIFAAVFSSVSFLALKAPFPNSTYDMSFWGPSYKCSPLSEIVATQNAPTWELSYGENYTSVQAVWDELIETNQNNSFNIYNAVAPEFMNNMILIWTGGVSNESHNASEGTRIICQLYNTSYDVSMHFDEGVQSIVPRSIKYLHPHAWNRGDASLAFSLGEPGIGAASVIHLLFTYFLTGTLSVGSVGALNSNNGESTMPLLQSGLIDCLEMKNSSAYFLYTHSHQCRNQTLGRAIEDLSRNFTYSLMTFDYEDHKFTTKVPVTVKSFRNFYSYDMRNLLTAYGTSLFIVLLWMGVGYSAIWSNGVTSSVSFSTIMLTTRNTDLDRLADGYSLGIHPLPRHIGETRMTFGCLGSGKSDKRAGFGFKGTVSQLKKGEALC